MQDNSGSALANDSGNPRNRILKVICGLLLTFVGSHILLALASIPAYYQRLTSGQVPTLVMAGDVYMSNRTVAEWAAQRGMTLEQYALYSVILNVTIALGFTAVAGLILLKSRREWFHWFTALVLIFFPISGLEEFVMVSQVGYDYVQLGALLWPSYPLFFYLFPNGRAVPGWTRWLIGPIVLFFLTLMAVSLAGSYFDMAPDVWEVVKQLAPLVLLAFPLILACQLYRYLRVSTPTERAQLKWFVAGLALLVVSSLLVELLFGASPTQSVRETGLRGDIEELLALFIPASIGIAILRYRLYDIDIIIRRTLIYAVLTALLAAVYFGGVALLQALLRPLTGAGNDLAVVATTLVIAALVLPVRRRVQSVIDRRFYRRKYDAAKTLAAFSDTVRDEVDLDKLTGRLVEVVDETMQPAHVSLWLRETRNKV